MAELQRFFEETDFLDPPPSSFRPEFETEAALIHDLRRGGVSQIDIS